MSSTAEILSWMELRVLAMPYSKVRVACASGAAAAVQTDDLTDVTRRGQNNDGDR